FRAGLLGLGRLGQGLVRDGILELTHSAPERASDLWQPLGGEEAERDQEEQREVRGTGQADHSCSSLIEMSVTAAPATATWRRSGRSSSQRLCSPGARE